jgi:hypothetical protein
MNYTLPLLSVDFEENTITLQATPEVMEKGFHAGEVSIELSGVQDKVDPAAHRQEGKE